MTTNTDDRRDSLGAEEARRVWPIRLIVGLVQGLALWWLWRSLSEGSQPGDWPSSNPALFAPLALIFASVPVIILGGLGRMRTTTLVVWAVVASAILAWLAWHGVARERPEDLEYGAPWIHPLLAGFAWAGLFIAHHLILPADQERRLLASYPAYFDTAWKAGVQLVMSVAFTGVFWLVLGLGVGLFGIIGLDFLGELVAKDWFAIPVTCLVFATAIHLSDVRDGLIRGVRTVALMLLSWILPLMTLLAAGFLAALPFTGLDGLFDTGSATALVLSAAAILIVLINTAYQDGLPEKQPPKILRGAVRVASVLLAPLIVIAVWALSLRIGQHGLTPDRIIACACAAVGAVYALGYAFAATVGYRRLGRWMQPLERTNVWAGVLAVLMIVALFSPILDPARLSVGDQMARLERGAVSPDRFDYQFLRFDSGRAGAEALATLAASDDPEIARRAREAQATEDRYSANLEDPSVDPAYERLPDTPPLPAGFGGPVTPGDTRHTCRADDACVVWAFDADGDGDLEVMLAQRFALQLWDQEPDRSWAPVANYSPEMCRGDQSVDDFRDLARQGALEITEPRWPAIDFGGERPMQPDATFTCR